jgi:glycosyltransferase involved in cell wall biosynthesis
MTTAPLAGMARGPRALLVDPSLFTGAYDAALSEGLMSNDVALLWAVRASRPGEDCEIPASLRAPIYYRGVEGSAKTGGATAQLRKGLSHLSSSLRLLRLADEYAPDVVHFQWVVFPLVDRLAIRRLARTRPVVVTVHDTNPFNGIPTSRLQLLGYAALLREADHLIVHTRQGRAALLRLGCAPERISVVPHGPLRLRTPPAPPRPRSDPRWTFVLFGKLQAYKGVDVLVEALASLDPSLRGRVRAIVAGEPFFDLNGLRARIEEADLQGCVDLRPARQSEAEMGRLFEEADAFVFPYRQIEASGVYHLVKGLGKWIVASNLGCFAEELAPNRGALTSPDDVAELAAALAASVGRRPEPGGGEDLDWIEIGRRTRAVYDRLLDERGRR